jgi:hypothetical protein
MKSLLGETKFEQPAKVHLQKQDKDNEIIWLWRIFLFFSCFAAAI